MLVVIHYHTNNTLFKREVVEMDAVPSIGDVVRAPEKESLMQFKVRYRTWFPYGDYHIKETYVRIAAFEYI